MKVAVIIVTYQGEKWISQCLDAVSQHDISTHIYVVDNGSTDSTLSIIKSYDSEHITTITLDKNMGFGYANNVAIATAIQDAYDYVFLLNQDAVVLPTTISSLVNISLENPEYYVLSPMQYSNTQEIDPDFREYLPKNMEINDQIPKIYNVPMVNAATWLIPVHVFEKIGGFNTDFFFHYGEDNNWCQRVIFHGGKIGVCSEVKAYHFRSNKNVDALHLLQRAFITQRVKMANILISDKAAKKIYFKYLLNYFLILAKSIITFNASRALTLMNYLFNGTIIRWKKVQNTRLLTKREGAHWIKKAQ